MNTEQATETETTESVLNKLYDDGYAQGFSHCKGLVDLMLMQRIQAAQISQTLETYITEKFPNLDKTPTP